MPVSLALHSIHVQCNLLAASSALQYSQLYLHFPLGAAQDSSSESAGASTASDYSRTTNSTDSDSEATTELWPQESL